MKVDTLTCWAGAMPQPEPSMATEITSAISVVAIVLVIITGVYVIGNDLRKYAQIKKAKERWAAIMDGRSF